jgi:hypothetical protein
MHLEKYMKVTSFVTKNMVMVNIDIKMVLNIKGIGKITNEKGKAKLPFQINHTLKETLLKINTKMKDFTHLMGGKSLDNFNNLYCRATLKFVREMLKSKDLFLKE